MTIAMTIATGLGGVGYREKGLTVSPKGAGQNQVVKRDVSPVGGSQSHFGKTIPIAFTQETRDSWQTRNQRPGLGFGPSSLAAHRFLHVWFFSLLLSFFFTHCRRMWQTS